MSTLTISYDKMNEDDKGKVEAAVAFFEGLGKDQKTIFATLKSAFSSLKDLFTFTSDKPKSATEVFNDFIAAQEWQDRYAQADLELIKAEGNLDAVLSQLSGLNVRWDVVLSKGANPEIVGLTTKLMKADNKEAFETASEPIAARQRAYMGISNVSNEAVHALYPAGMTKTVKDGHEQPSWTAVKVEKNDETGKWEAAGRAASPVDPNKPRPIGVARVGKTTVTVTYGEELVYSGSNKNLAYTKGGIFASDHKLPGWTDERYQGFGRRNGQEVLVATDWIHTGMDRLQKAGLTVKEELTTKA